ncbi:MAG: queuosine salvage family protein [Candidatus Acidiferrales bacterium]
MKPNRRTALQQFSSLGVAAAASILPQGASSSGGAARTIRWPKPIGSPVLDSLRPVIENSLDVRTHVDKIIEVAGWMAYEELPMPQFSVPFGLAKDPPLAIDFIMVATAINSAFTDFKSHQKFEIVFAGEHLSDSLAMFACLKRAMDNGIPILDGKFLSQVTRPELEKIFAGNIEMPMLDEKTEVFNQVGAVLAKKYEGRFYNFIRSCSPKLYGNGNGLVERLVKEFPRFNDVSMFEGHEIKFYKLTQLGFWGIYAGLHTTGAFQLDDPQKMTAFADYIVPVALRLMGITSYTPPLERAINTYQLIPRDSRAEIEIRAHTLYATALLTEEINKFRPAKQAIIIPQLDARLWSHYHTTFWPHHLTETIMY